MKKPAFYLVITTLLLPTTLLAAPRTRTQAQAIAEQFMRQHSGAATLNDITDEAAAAIARNFDEESAATDTEFIPYYIYNSDEQAGFVLISGSDQMRPVLGYCDQPFDAETLPENMQAWLKGVQQAAILLEEHPEYALTARQLSASTTAISPLLGNIAWDQDTPFNNLCPLDKRQRSYTGCVATAAAQCVYYYRYPSQGTGSHTDAYNTSLTVNFSQATYDYSLMFDQYDSKKSYTSSQLNEVAKLSYHCGVLCDMQYSSDGSGAYYTDLRKGLVNYLKYDPYAQVLHRSCFSYDEWTEIMINELEHKRPILYSGNSDNNTSGHAFVLDGIDTEGHFHVNWGWSGEYNGYYDITVLNPVGTGIGAEISPDGFCTDQEALVQLAPKGKVEDAVYYTSLYGFNSEFTLSKSSITLGGSLTYTINTLYNYSADAVTGYLGLAFVQEGKVVTYSQSSSSLIRLSEASEEGFSGIYATDIPVTIPTSLKAGTYQVYACFIPSTGDFQNKCGLIHVEAKSPSYYTCVVANGKATLSRSDYSVQLEMSEWKASPENPKVGEKQTISCQIQNKAADNTLVGKFYLCLTSPTGYSKFVECEDVQVLAPGEKGTLNFETTYNKTGNWTASLYVFLQNIDEDTNTDRRIVAGTSRTITVGSDGSTDAQISLTAAPTLVSHSLYGDSLFAGVEYTFSVPIKNTGKAYTGDLQMRIFRTYNSTAHMALISGSVNIPAAYEGTITFTGKLTQVTSSYAPAKTGTTYYGILYYRSGDSYAKLSSSTSTVNRVSLKCYPTPDYVSITQVEEEAEAQVIYDLWGHRLKTGERQSQGLYIINGKKSFGPQR